MAPAGTHVVVSPRRVGALDQSGDHEAGCAGTRHDQTRLGEQQNPDNAQRDPQEDKRKTEQGGDDDELCEHETGHEVQLLK